MEMSNEIGSRVRYGEAFWRAHHEAWRDLRRQAASLRRCEFEMNRVRHAMNQIEPAKVRALLMEIADILSPGTTAEQVRPDFF
jgi:hypothetical protein